MRFSVHLIAFVRRVLSRGAARPALPPAASLQAPLPALAGEGGRALQAVAALDDHTLWPTHRIRRCLHDPAPGSPAARR